MARPDHKSLTRAVALRYSGEGAPRVTAKGAGQVAERILAAAEEHDIPLYEDPQLLQLLAQIDLNAEIPEELYVAIARIIAFAYSLSGKAPPLRTGDGGE